MTTARFLLVLVAMTVALPVAAQTQDDDARREALVREAVARFDRERAQVPPTAQPPAVEVPAASVRELRMEDALELALSQNLDIAIERLTPQAADFQVAGLRNFYRPLASSAFGQRHQVNPATNTLAGGNRVVNDTTTYNLGVTQEMPWGGGNFNLAFGNTRLATSNQLANYNPAFNSVLNATFTQPLLRDFTIDNNRQQIAIARINRDIGQETLRATIAQTIANVRNAYWELAFARAAVDVAQRSFDLAQKLVEDNQARVEVGTLAPIDVVQAEAEAANRRQTVAQVEATLATAQLTLKRLLVTGTSDPLWTQELRATDVPQLDAPPLDVEAAVRAALEQRTDLATARKNLDSNDVTLRFWRNQTRPALDLQLNYGAAGLGGQQLERTGSGPTAALTGNVIPGGTSTRCGLSETRISRPGTRPSR